MNVFEMEGFLRGKCVPRDLKVNETNAEYLVRKFAEAEAKCAALAERIEELQTKPTPDSFGIIGENIRTQDNRITSDPMFCVYQKREIVVDADYDYDRIVWVDEDGNEANKLQSRRLELLHENFREPPEKWRRVAVKDIDEFVTCCFTLISTFRSFSSTGRSDFPVNANARFSGVMRTVIVFPLARRIIMRISLSSHAPGRTIDICPFISLSFDANASKPGSHYSRKSRISINRKVRPASRAKAAKC